MAPDCEGSSFAVNLSAARSSGCDRSGALVVKYALMGISFILLIWAGTFYLML
ncbi:membrane protein YpdK [Pantoea sp. FN060301]|uniref:membrane protein YpdK n=1 Tax=Pantoea sp. FN060301 TaxID=3420380 RepID=UPI003D17A39A